jgi:hypothetical protein
VRDPVATGQPSQWTTVHLLRQSAQENPLVCCLSFALSSLPLSHATTPLDTTHGLLATSSLSFFLSLLSSLFSLFLSLSSFFSSSPVLPFILSLLFSDYLQLKCLTAVVLYCTTICFLLFFFFFLISAICFLFILLQFYLLSTA